MEKMHFLCQNNFFFGLFIPLFWVYGHFFHHSSKNNVFTKFLSIKLSLSPQKKLRHTISIVTRASLTPYSAISLLSPQKSPTMTQGQRDRLCDTPSLTPLKSLKAISADVIQFEQNRDEMTW